MKFIEKYRWIMYILKIPVSKPKIKVLVYFLNPFYKLFFFQIYGLVGYNKGIPYADIVPNTIKHGVPLSKTIWGFKIIHFFKGGANREILRKKYCKRIMMEGAWRGVQMETQKYKHQIWQDTNISL